jgi:hypothetical protein
VFERRRGGSDLLMHGRCDMRHWALSFLHPCGGGLWCMLFCLWLPDMFVCIIDMHWIAINGCIVCPFVGGFLRRRYRMTHWAVLCWFSEIWIVGIISWYYIMHCDCVGRHCEILVWGIFVFSVLGADSNRWLSAGGYWLWVTCTLMRGDGFLSSCKLTLRGFEWLLDGSCFMVRFWRVKSECCLTTELLRDESLHVRGGEKGRREVGCGNDRIRGWEVCVRARDGLLSAAPLTVTGHICFIFRTHSSPSKIWP